MFEGNINSTGNGTGSSGVERHRGSRRLGLHHVCYNFRHDDDECPHLPMSPPRLREIKAGRMIVVVDDEDREK